MSNYPAPTSDSAISGLTQIDQLLTFSDLFIISVKLTNGYYTGKITLEQLKIFFVDNIQALEIAGLTQLLDGKANASHLHKTADITDLSSVLAGKANSTHTHQTNQILGLATLLDEKANVIHSHEMSAIAGLASALANKANVIHSHVMGDINGLPQKIQIYDDWIANGGSNHTHQISQILGLQDILDGKASVDHQHTIGNVTGLQTALDGKSPLQHSHTTADISDLSLSLENKADKVHTHVLDDITGLIDALAGKANASHTHSVETISGLTELLEQKATKDHTHTIGNVTGLQLALDNKSDLAHVHGIDEVTGLRDELAEKAPLQHTHEITDVRNLEAQLNASEKTENKVGSLESNSTIYYPTVSAVRTYVDSKFQELGSPIKTINNKNPDVNGNISITKVDLGLNFVDNTADSDKPVSTATSLALEKKVDVVLENFDPEAGLGRVVEGDEYLVIIAKLQRQIDWLMGVSPMPAENPATITVSGHSFKLSFEKDVRFSRILLSDIEANFPETLRAVFGGDFINVLGDGIDNSAITINATDKELEIILGTDWLYNTFVYNRDGIENGGSGTGKLPTTAVLEIGKFVSVDGGVIPALANLEFDLMGYTNLSEFGIVHTREDYERSLIGGVWDTTPIYDMVNPNPITDIILTGNLLSLEFSRDVNFNGVPLEDYTGTTKDLLAELFEESLFTDLDSDIDYDNIIVSKASKRLAIQLLPEWLAKDKFKTKDTQKTGKVTDTLTLELSKFEAISGEDMVATRSPSISITTFANTSNYIGDYTSADYDEATVLGSWDDVLSYINIPGVKVKNLEGGYHE